MPIFKKHDFLFTITDDNDKNVWAAKRLGGQPWLLKWIDTTGQWITVRSLTEQEVEEYQRHAGCYPRA